ncbi:flagella synthesis protein FlgN [Crenobacter luteus]|uniref:Flagellar biosynthesis protein FlgN n=1 Tax=Crenobacter luteus TaxID=1452487 RepID=A0A161S886_9NEIS|nr:flagellar export chaperone FlgN [Crenobacter luteus]KZE30042.1 hypothetical protein AVW16_12990 [Crenobacter luteus]
MNDAAEHFAALCREEAGLLAALSQTLEDEQRALLGRDAQALLALSERKAAQLAALAAPSRARADAMRAAGLGDAARLHAWLAERPDALAAWEALELALARARALNAHNGGLLGQRLDQVEEALTVLKSAAAATVSYHRDGSQGAVLSGGRHLGSA